MEDIDYSLRSSRQILMHQKEYLKSNNKADKIVYRHTLSRFTFYEVTLKSKV